MSNKDRKLFASSFRTMYKMKQYPHTLLRIYERVTLVYRICNYIVFPSCTWYNICYPYNIYTYAENTLDILIAFKEYLQFIYEEYTCKMAFFNI